MGAHKCFQLLTWRSTSKHAVLLVLCAAFAVSYYAILLGNQYISVHIQSHCEQPTKSATTLANVVFGIASGKEVWQHRRNYVKLWWRPHEMRGYIMDQDVEEMDNLTLPPMKMREGLSSSFSFDSPWGSKTQEQQIRTARLFSELFRLKLPDVHWFVVGDDDTIFVADNLVKILSKYDHHKFYYIGMYSETHLQSVQFFSTNTAFGGGGIALSYALVEALEQVHDDCIRRYYHIWGGDGKTQACMAELGVPLTPEAGFHQMDIHGDISGFLTGHPVAPLVSLHHLDLVHPIFPGMNQLQAFEHLSSAIKVDSAGILQQSFCYNKVYNWTIKVAWGYAVEVSRGLIPPRVLEDPLRTFGGWRNGGGAEGFPFKTRGVHHDPCLRHVMFFMSTTRWIEQQYPSMSNYRRNEWDSGCKLEDALTRLKWIYVTKEPTHYKAPRRQCCNIRNPQMQKMQQLEIRDCSDGEISVA